MKLRIYFTAEDLARTRIASAPDHMWEIASSLQLLQHRGGALVFDRWRRWARQRLASAELGGTIRALTALYPHAAYFPDFLTPAAHSGDLAKGIDTVLSTSASRIRAELTRLSTDQRLPARIRGMVTGDPDTLRGFGGALRRYHDTVIAPQLSYIHACLDADRASKVRALRDGGVEGLLRSLRPLTRWQPPVLEVRYPCDQELRLDGRGLLLVPSFFTWGTPVSLADRDLPPVLVYPVHHGLDWLQPTSGHPTAPLTALIGPTRAAVLAATVSGATTTELARRLDIAPATVTHHTAVLRDARLITSQRHANTTVHTIAPLGDELLGDGYLAISSSRPRPRRT